MNRTEFIHILDGRLKLVRTEYDFTQDKMADVLGLSKKTLVQIEKQRASLGWTGAVALCAVFRDSEILAMTLGGQPQDLILTLAFREYERQYPQTMGGRVWWREIEAKGRYRIQQNVISQHYRILDQKDHRICSSLDVRYMRKRLRELAGQEGRAAKHAL